MCALERERERKECVSVLQRENSMSVCVLEREREKDNSVGVLER